MQLFRSTDTWQRCPACICVDEYFGPVCAVFVERSASSPRSEKVAGFDPSLSTCESLQVPAASAGVCDLGPPASFHPPVMGMSADVLVAAAPQVGRLKKKLKLENEAEYAELYRRPRQCCIRFNLDAVD